MIPSIFTIALALNGAAVASHGHVRDFGGSYSVACDAAELTLHATLDGEINGVQDSVRGAWTVELPCEGLDEAEAAALAAEVTAFCDGLGLNAGYCEDLGEEAALALAEVNDELLAELIPEQVDFTVTGTGSWLYRLLKVYPMRGVHTMADGDTNTLTYFINDNANSRGDFWTAAVALPRAGFLGPLGCSEVASGQVLGNLDHTDGYALSAEYIRDQSLVCGAMVDDHWLVGTLGLTLDAELVGERLP